MIDRRVDTLEKLERLAGAHRDRLSHLTWAELAQSLEGKPLLRTGETWGHEEDGVEYDVGDSVEWVREVGGDIRQRFYAALNPATVEQGSVYFTRIIRKPKPIGT